VAMSENRIISWDVSLENIGLFLINIIHRKPNVFWVKQAMNRLNQVYRNRRVQRSRTTTPMWNIQRQNCWTMIQN
jgi:hypothetical protein